MAKKKPVSKKTVPAKSLTPAQRRRRDWLIVRQSIADNPYYEQGAWLNTLSYKEEQGHEKVNPNICGTGGCIAGSAAFGLGLITQKMAKSIRQIVKGIHNDTTDESELQYLFHESGLPDAVAKKLGLTEFQQSILFSAEPQDSWPFPWSKAWRAIEDIRDSSSSSMAQLVASLEKAIALDFIDSIIEKGTNVISGGDV